MAGGQVGSLLSSLFGLVVSGSTLLRRVKQGGMPTLSTPRVLGVDDWAAAADRFKKRERYGTILVDLEKRQVIDLLPDRETDTLKTWLEEHPSIEVISRDRAAPRRPVRMRWPHHNQLHKRCRWPTGGICSKT